MPNGWIISAAVILPNIVFMIFPPQSFPIGEGKKSIVGVVMEVFEKVGQMGCFAIPFFYTFSLHGSPRHEAIIVVMLALLKFYYVGWIRYFFRGRDLSLLFKPMWGIPLPMAIAPVLYFAVASFVLHSVYLLAASIVLGIGHIFVSESTRRRLTMATDGSKN